MVRGCDYDGMIDVSPEWKWADAVFRSQMSLVKCELDGGMQRGDINGCC